MYSTIVSSITIVLLGILNIHSYTICTFFLVVTFDLQARLVMDFTYAFSIFDFLSVFFLFNFSKYYWIIPTIYCGYGVYEIVEQDDSSFYLANAGIGVLGCLLVFNQKYKSAVFGILYFLISLWGLNANLKPVLVLVRSVWYYLIRLDHSVLKPKAKAVKRISVLKKKKLSTSSISTPKVESQASFETL